MKLTERRRLHELTKAQLESELADAERSLLEFRFNAGLNRLTNPAGLHHARKLVATLKTLIREKELLAESGFDSIDQYKVFRNAERKAFRASGKSR